jgi:hypothetical protein
MLRAPAVEYEPVINEEMGLAEFVNFAWGFLRRRYVVVIFCALLAIVLGLVVPPIGLAGKFINRLYGSA